MGIDPNVQVALVSVFATMITTLGVITVAIINNRKERAKAADAGVEAGLDEKDVLEKILTLMRDGEQKDQKIATLEAEIKGLRAENTLLRLGVNPRD